MLRIILVVLLLLPAASATLEEKQVVKGWNIDDGFNSRVELQEWDRNPYLYKVYRKDTAQGYVTFTIL